MRCPKCGKDVELQKKQVGVDENGKPIFNEFAICKDCRKQWNLDKQRDKKASNASNHIQSKVSAPAKAKPVAAKDGNMKAEGAKPATQPVSKHAEKKEPVNRESANKVPIDKVPVNKSPVNKAPAKKASPKQALSSSEKKPAAIGKASATPNGSAPVKKAVPSGTTPAASSAHASDPVKKTAPADRAAVKGRPAPGSKASLNSKEIAGSKPAPGSKPAAPARKLPDTDSSTGPVPRTASAGQKPAQRKKPASAEASRRRPVSADDEQKYGNIPPEKVRTKRERAVKDSYEEMLTTDPDRKPANRKRPADDAAKKKPVPTGSTPVKKRLSPKPIEEDLMERDEPDPKFRTLRIIFGIVSIVAFGFFAYKAFMAGLDNISSGKDTTTGTTYIVLALCMLVAGLLLLIMQKKRTIFSFVLPMIFYLGCAAFAFFKRADDKFLLYGAIMGAVLAVIFLVLTIASRGGDEDYDYDDPFDEEHDN